MARYLVLRCPKCKRIITADGANKKRTCPRCSREIELRKQRILFSADTAQKAARAAQQVLEIDQKKKGKGGEFTS